MSQKQVTCHGCEHQFSETDTAPYGQDTDGLPLMVCRKCIGTWIKQAFMNPNYPFWKLKEMQCEKISKT